MSWPNRPANLDSWLIGFDNTWSLLDSMLRASSASATYPPYNIIRTGEDRYLLEVAVAGFAREELSITLEDRMLKIEGSRNSDETSYIHKGIAGRDFKHEFALGEYVVVRGASLENGILSVEFERELPEEKRPRVINIS